MSVLRSIFNRHMVPFIFSAVSYAALAGASFAVGNVSLGIGIGAFAGLHSIAVAVFSSSMRRDPELYPELKL